MNYLTTISLQSYGMEWKRRLKIITIIIINKTMAKIRSFLLLSSDEDYSFKNARPIMQNWEYFLFCTKVILLVVGK